MLHEEIAAGGICIVLREEIANELKNVSDRAIFGIA